MRLNIIYIHHIQRNKHCRRCWVKVSYIANTDQGLFLDLLHGRAWIVQRTMKDIRPYEEKACWARTDPLTLSQLLTKRNTTNNLKWIQVILSYILVHCIYLVDICMTYFQQHNQFYFERKLTSNGPKRAGPQKIFSCFCLLGRLEINARMKFVRIRAAENICKGLKSCKGFVGIFKDILLQYLGGKANGNE